MHNGGIGHGGAGPGPLVRPRRPRELQDPLNRWLYHPISWQLAKLLRHTPLTPNMVSVIGALFVIGAGAAYAQPWYPWSVALGLFLHMSWHVIDGADGDLARMTGRSSPLGEMVDGACDYLSHVVLYFVLVFLLQAQIGPVAWAWAVAAGASHIVQSNHVEVQRRQYQWWIYGTPWLRNNAGSIATIAKRRSLAGFAELYLQLASGLTPVAHRIDDAVEAAQGNPPRLEAIRAEVRREAPPLLLLVKFLGPNPRAIVLGGAMFAGSPLYYFIYQSIVLNALMVVSVIAHNRAARRIAARIEA